MATVVNPVRLRGGKRVTVGVALSVTALCAVRPSGASAHADSGVWRLPLTPLNGDGIGWPALASALKELAERLDTDDGVLHVVLMPPLTEIRRLDLPPMGEQELRTLLSRNAMRYFAGARSAQLVGTISAPRRSASPLGSVMAAAAPQRLIAALHSAARDAGWTVEAVSPAEGAWCSAASALWPAAGRHASHLLVCGEDRTELLQLEQGRLVGVRRFRAGSADAALVVEALRAGDAPHQAVEGGRIAAVGVSARRMALARALSTAGLAISAAPQEWAERSEHPDELAAEFAGPNAAPLFRSEASLAQRREAGRRVVMRLVAASAGLLLLAAAFLLIGEKRQLRAVQAERAAIKPQISATLVGRTSVETAFRQLSALAGAQRSATQWSAVIAGVSEHLDGQAYLTSMRGRDDSLLVEGIAVRAAKAFDSLVRTPGLASVRAAAPVRRESPQGGPALERFTIAAVVKHAGANGSTPTTATQSPKVAP
jgi:hypothetical protein